MQRTHWLALVTCLGLTATVSAQPPPPPPVVAVPAVAAPTNLWTFLCLTPDQKAACRDAWCKSPFGQLSSSAMGPVSGLAGGLIPNCCAANAIEEGLKKPAES